MMGLIGDDESGTEPNERPIPPSQHPRKPRPVTARRTR
jgi:hypothetical protein